MPAIGAPAYDLIVVGLGAMGSAVAWRAAIRGLRVLAVDMHETPHSLGSTHGRSRIIREAYFEHPSYVPLVRLAYDLWGELEATAGLLEPLLRTTGGLMIGPPDGVLVSGSLESARHHGIEHELLTADEVRRRFPAYTPADGMMALLEHRAGILAAERSVEAMQSMARAHGAELRAGVAVVGWNSDRAGVVVQTASGDRLESDRLAIAAGPWANLLLQPKLPLSVERQLFHTFAPLDPLAPVSAAACPVALIEDPGGPLFATFPDTGDGVKIGIHHGGVITTPEDVDRVPRAKDERAVRRLLARYMPSADGALLDAAVCLYTNTPDHDFVIDFVDADRRVVLASPCSGHGFKFATAVGEVVTELCVLGASRQDLSRFGADRFRLAGAPGR